VAHQSGYHPEVSGSRILGDEGGYADGHNAEFNPEIG
jgi:hypothetical protein